jgi:hypothetical protein
LDEQVFRLEDEVTEDSMEQIEKGEYYTNLALGWNINLPTEYLPLGHFETSSFKTPAFEPSEQEPLPLNS